MFMSSPYHTNLKLLMTNLLDSLHYLSKPCQPNLIRFNFSKNGTNQIQPNCKLSPPSHCSGMLYGFVVIKSFMFPIAAHC
ncbi:hypothetical protein HanRHA438_Chr12g0555451 [Helianthus annuus]|nr:hypothetical protein HanLR1_Chr12g0448141 [Helianthus annuus]KAJ0866763.1 hypothetical protein HanRHA438_Chr12g0555451 [Helianthus annuus]